MLRSVLFFALIFASQAAWAAPSASIANIEGRRFFTITPQQHATPAAQMPARFLPLKNPSRAMPVPPARTKPLLAVESNELPAAGGSAAKPQKQAAPMDQEQAKQILAIFSHSE